MPDFEYGGTPFYETHTDELKCPYCGARSVQLVDTPNGSDDTPIFTCSNRLCEVGVFKLSSSPKRSGVFASSRFNPGKNANSDPHDDVAEGGCGCRCAGCDDLDRHCGNRSRGCKK